LLARDLGNGEIARSMQLIAGCTGRAYNVRKNRRGAFWEDFYQPTIVDTDEYLARCFTYIDLNMVRAGVVEHPREWRESGYHEIQNPPTRYRIIDRGGLSELLGVEEERLGEVQNEWIDSQIRRGNLDREPHWTEAVAVGRRSFVEDAKERLGARARYREVKEFDGISILREPPERYRHDWEVGIEALRRNVASVRC
jgi:putative transposase